MIIFLPFYYQQLLFFSPIGKKILILEKQNTYLYYYF